MLHDESNNPLLSRAQNAYLSAIRKANLGRVNDLTAPSWLTQPNPTFPPIDWRLVYRFTINFCSLFSAMWCVASPTRYIELSKTVFLSIAVNDLPLILVSIAFTTVVTKFNGTNLTFASLAAIGSVTCALVMI